MTELVDFRIRCPSCQREVLSRANGREARCAACEIRYPIEAGVLQLLPPGSERRTLAQAAMEWPPLVRIYESRLWRRNPVFALALGISFERECALITEAAALRADHHALDLACGSGNYARRFARTVSQGTVVGLDLSAPMLTHGQRKADAQGLRNLQLVRGDAMELPFEDGRFDLVNCCGALHLFPSVPKVLGEIARVLRPGGRFTAAVVGRAEHERAERNTARRRAASGVDAFTPAQLCGLLEVAGLGEAAFPHEGPRWLVVTAGG